MTLLSWSRVYWQNTAISCTASYLWQPSSWNTILFSSSVNVIIYFLHSGLIACKYHIAAYFCSPASLSSEKNFSRMSILSLDETGTVFFLWAGRRGKAGSCGKRRKKSTSLERCHASPDCFWVQF